MNFILNLDQQILIAMNSLAGKWQILDLFGIFCAKYLIFIIAGIIIGWWIELHKTRATSSWPLEGKRKWLTFGHVSSAVLISILINYILGFIKFRTRPFINLNLNQLVNPLSEKSFPSDHTTVVFAAAITVLFYNKKLGIFLLSLSVLVAITRIFVGVHYPLDIISGIIVAIISSVSTWFVFRQRKQTGGENKSRLF